MAKKKSRNSRVSNGGRQKANIAHEKKRQAKFAAKRENGTAYEYKPNPFKKGTNEYNREMLDRAEKAKSKKLPIAKRDSVFRKLDNWVAADKEKKTKNRTKAAKAA